MPKLDPKGFVDESGAITILETGNIIDPYFTLQALLLARENGLDISPHAEKWAEWLIARQRPDGSFDRFCRTGPVWLGCKSADADDALLAIWMKFLRTMPKQLKEKPSWRKSYDASSKALGQLYDPQRGVYLVSPVFQHGLFMDNLEVWSYKTIRGGVPQNIEAREFARAIRTTFWDAKGQRFLVSTQPEQKSLSHTFYPEHVAQIFPLLFDFPLLPTDASTYYRQWMKDHRATWLHQVKSDYAWGLLAFLAWKQRDNESAQCWLREALPYQQTGHWTFTDEVVAQLLQAKGVIPAAAKAACS
ncbi:hypothetical protein GCM10022212_28010 [Actimicrobium antarcticum]|uniref:Uncharacterized protein n=2 Tax=Actimicrobium antarcticum TaxID=1051899 RepID=A0ABP7TNQ1_9BURK